MRLHAYSLLFSLVLSTVIFGITNSLMMNNLFFSKESSSSISLVQSGLDAESGIYYGLKNLNLEMETIVDLFGEGKNEVFLSKKNWGAFNVITSTSKTNGYNVRKSVLCGNLIRPDYVLTLKDNNRPLSLSGNTIIKGNCLLPKAGVKRAYIEGRSFSGKQLINGQVNHSSSTAPNSNFYEIDLKQIIESDVEDSTVFLEDLKDSLFHPFDRKTLNVILTDQRAILSGYYAGNIVFKSNDEIVIGSDCALRDVIVLSEHISIEPGFRGSGQFIASKRVNVKEAILEYPSLVFASVSTTDNENGIQCYQSSICGGLILNEKGNKKIKSGISIDKSSTVTGIVETNSWVELKGKVHGQVTASSFLLRTPSSVYQNHLIDATISAIKIEGGFPLVVFDETRSNSIIKWLD